VQHVLRSFLGELELPHDRRTLRRLLWRIRVPNLQLCALTRVSANDLTRQFILRRYARCAFLFLIFNSAPLLALLSPMPPVLGFEVAAASGNAAVVRNGNKGKHRSLTSVKRYTAASYNNST
jgi:hypothetical protein